MQQKRKLLLLGLPSREISSTLPHRREKKKFFTPTCLFSFVTVLVKSDDEDAKFTRFFLTVENENKLLSHGQLELYDDELSQFSQHCPNAVVQTSQVLKDEISVYWTSPEEGNGCVIFR